MDICPEIRNSSVHTCIVKKKREEVERVKTKFKMRTGKKTMRSDDGDDAEPVMLPETIGQKTSHILNKQVRSQKYQKLKHEKNKNKKAERKRRQKEEAKAEELGITLPPKEQPKVWFCST